MEILRNKRGQIINDVKKNLELGELYEKQFQSFMVNKYNINLIKDETPYNSYDFFLVDKPNVFVEYKALHIKTVINNEPYYYEYIVIPKCKIDNFIKRYEDGLKNNKLFRFFYIISIYYKIGDKQYKRHKYIYLDLYKIKHECNVIDALTDKNDREPHYQLLHDDFKHIVHFKKVLTTDY